MSDYNKIVKRFAKQNGGALMWGEPFSQYAIIGCSNTELDIDGLLYFLDKWAAEHPVKTYAMDFFEKFPNAPTQPSGRPDPCVMDIYGREGFGKCKKGEIVGACIDCWNREIPKELNK